MSGKDYPYARFSDRFVADLIDCILAAGITLPFWFVFDMLLNDKSITVLLGQPDEWVYSKIVMAAVSLYNMTYLVGKTGQSWGRKYKELKVVDYAGNPIGFWKALLRNFLAATISSIFFLGFISMIWDERRQAWHDKLMKTFVVCVET